MPKSYVDEIVIRYLMKEGYLISQGIWFSLPKKKQGKRYLGGVILIIFAVKPNASSLVIQCKSFLGTEKSTKIIENVINWFNNAIDFLKNSNYKDWVLNENYRKVLVVDYSVKKTEEELKKAWFRNLEI
jgi:hypothetical protein